ncbi:hypothetical protein Tco_1164898 [Tanacetum coccineum]
MSSASSAVTYTSVYIDSESGRVFWGANEEISDGGSPRVIVLGYDGLPIQPVAPPSPDYIPGPEEPQTPPVPQDEDKREPMFIQPHDPDYVPEPIYPEYIPLEDERYVVESDPEEYEDDKTKDGPVNYPMDGGEDGDDDDGDSSGDDVDDEDEDEEGEDKEEEEHLAPANSVVIVPTVELVSPSEGTEPVIPPPSTNITTNGARITVRLQASISLPPEAERLARCTTPSAHSSPPPVPSPVLPSSGCPTQIQTLRIASTQALVDAVTTALPSPLLPPLPQSLYISPPVDRRDDVTESEQPPRNRSCLFALGSRDTWVNPAEAVREIAPMTVGEVNTRVTELAELREHDTHELYALLEDAQDSRTRISQRVTMDSQQAIYYELQTHREQVYAHESQLHAHQTQLQLQGTLIQTQHQVHETRSQMQQVEMAELRETGRRHQEQMIETLRVMRDMRREMGNMQAELLAMREQQRRARQPAPDARVPDHQDASRDADSHI